MIHPTANNLRPAYTMVRSLILAVSTLAIVGVLFTVYQYSAGPETPGPMVAAPPLSLEPPPPVEESAASLPIGEGRVGGGQRITISLYEPHSNRARAQLEVSDWQPVGESSNEFHVTEPEIRLRTPDGQQVRITADEGWIQLAKGDARTPEAKSGRFVGHVEIDIDRLSERERVKLPEAQRHRLDPQRLIHLEFDEIRFDLEEARLDSSGPFSLRMAEAVLDGVGLHLRYNDVDSRVELLQITELKQLVIRGGRQLFEVSIPGTAETVPSGPTESSKPVLASTTAEQPAVIIPEETQSDPEMDELPLFVPDPPDDPKAWPVQSYVVEIDRDVSVRRITGDEVVWKLEADKLELLFDFGQEQRQAVRKGEIAEPGSNVVPEPPSGSDEALGGPDEHMVLNCSGSFVLRPRRTDEVDDSETPGRRLRLTAAGDVHFSDARASVSCMKLDVRKDSGEVRIIGAYDNPIILRTTQCAELTAVNIFIDRERGVAHITGPARLADSGDEPGDGPAALAVEGFGTAGVDVRFDDSAELTLGVHTLRRINPSTNEIEEIEIEYITKALFSGNVKMKRGSDLIAGQVIEMTFDAPTRPGAFAQSIHTLDVTGGVVMQRGAQRLTCADLSVSFAEDPSGQMVPRFAEAIGDVVMSQGPRTLTADDHVAIEMAPVIKRRPPFDIAQARRHAVARGIDPSTVDWEAVRWEHERQIEYTIGLRSLVAEGSVTAFDPSEGVDVMADKLMCDFGDQGDIRTAHLTGPEGRDAFVEYRDFSVAAHDIDVDIEEQRMEVFGAGTLTLVTQRGLDGSRSETPQHVTISWVKELVFRGDLNTARFNGKVHAVTRRLVPAPPTLLARLGAYRPMITQEASSFDCDELVIDFVDTETPPKPKDDAARQWGIFAPLVKAWGKSGDAGRPKLNKEPVFVVASRGVVGVFTNTDLGSGRIKNRVRIACDILTVDLPNELMTVPVKGTILIENYKRPDAAKPTSRSNSPFGTPVAGMPSQSYLEWAESMSYHFGRNRADFRRDVLLIHRSGARMAFAGDLMPTSDSYPDGLKAQGRRTRLECQSLIVEFSDRGQEKLGTNRGAGRMNVREIRQLDAAGGVYLVDDQFTITAHRIVKFPQSDLLRVFGFDGEDAEIYGQRANGPRFRGPEFSYHLTSGRVEASGPHRFRMRR